MLSVDLAACVTFDLDGERIISASFNGLVRIWDAHFESKEEQGSIGHSGEVDGVCISRDGLRVASGSGDKTVRLWNAQTGTQIGPPLEGHTDSVHCVSFSPDGRLLVSGSSDKTLRIWNTETCTEIGNPFEGHSDAVYCVCFSSDGHRIVSGGRDKTVVVWNVATREQIGDPLIRHKNLVTSVAESSDGRFVVSRASIAETIIWDRDSCAVVWKSGDRGGSAKNAISNIDAESIIRSCGEETPRLWPRSFPKYSADVYCDGYSVFSNVLGEKILLADLPSFVLSWKFDDATKLLAAGLRNGGVAICRLAGSLFEDAEAQQVAVTSGTCSPDGRTIAPLLSDRSTSSHEENMSSGNAIPTHELIEMLSLNKDCLSERIVSMVDASSRSEDWGNAVKFSSRFSAVWAALECDDTAIVWFCLVDGESCVFALESTSSSSESRERSLEVTSGENGLSIRCLGLPREISWSSALQCAADFMETHNEIRAVLMACIVSTRSRGGKSCVSDALIPENLKTLSVGVQYDIPIDVDLMTTLADALNIDNVVYFICGLGTLAKVAGFEKGVCHLQQIDVPETILRHERLKKPLPRLPILYGYGQFLDTDEPRATAQIGNILEELPEKSNISELLSAIVNDERPLRTAGNLDLLAAANVIYDMKGAILGEYPPSNPQPDPQPDFQPDPQPNSRPILSKLKRITSIVSNKVSEYKRKIDGDVLVVGDDGIYKSSRFKGVAIEGSCQINVAIVKLGMKATHKVDRTADKRIETLREIAEIVLGRKYDRQYFERFNENLVYGPSNRHLWSKETAVCNTLVGLVCKKYGRFTGFSAVVYELGTDPAAQAPTMVSEPGTDLAAQAPTMNANIFLPALKVWLHPKRQGQSGEATRLKSLLDQVCSIAHWKGCQPELVRYLKKKCGEPWSSKAREIEIHENNVLAIAWPRIGFTDIEIMADISD